MSTRVDFEKSILKEKLVFRRDLYGYLDSFFENTLALILPLTFLLLLSNKKNYEVNESVYFIFICTLLVLWPILGMFFLKKLVKINGLNPESNRRKMVELLSKKYPKELFNSTGERIIISKRSTGLFSWGRIITILFQDENIYINITTLGRFDIRSAFHGLTNYIKCKRIANEFQKHIIE